MVSLKASQQGLARVKRAIAQKGWTMSDDRWLLEASKMLEPQGDWHESGPYAYGCSRQTWERFLQGTAVRDRSFIAFCRVLDLDPNAVAQSVNNIREDWGEAPDVPVFHGRQQELTTLDQWILKERCQLITIVGFAGIGKTRLVRGGIGKTDLSLRLARRVRGEFDCLIWRRLLNAPPLEVILSELIEFVSDDRETHLATTPDGLVTQLLHYLQQCRCLLILDNAESILQAGAGTYRTGYERYGDLFRRIGETKHQSCLLVTSREKPQDIKEMEGTQRVRSLELEGLDRAAGQAIFRDIGCIYNASFQGSDSDWETLISFYSGNPLALEVLARHILRQFHGNLSEFLNQDLRVFGKIRDLLDWHFDRLSEAEKEVLYWLAINREAVSISDLREDILLPLNKKQLPETLDTLEQHLPVERIGNKITLQPVLIEYLTDRLIEQICRELKSGKLQLFNSHALIEASVKDYVRESQIRLILNPVIEQIASVLGIEEQNSLEHQLSQILANLQQTYQKRPGYAAGNLLNLMRYGNLDISGCDFSHLSIWQADLQGIDLNRVNFTACEFARSNLTQNFGGVHAIAFSPNGDLLAMGDSNGDIWLFETQNNQLRLHLIGYNQSLWITSLAFSPDGKWLVSGGFDCTVRLWDTHAGECLKILEGHQKWIWAVAFSPDGKWLVSGGDDNIIRLWNTSTWECQVLEGHEGWVWAVAFSPDGTTLASGGCDNTVRLWHLDTQECFKVLNGHESGIWSVAFHPSGRILASGSLDCTVKLWNIDADRCLSTLQGHTDVVRSIAFNNDGTILASGSFDDTIRLWSCPTGESLRTLKGHFNGIHSVTFAPDRNILASGDNSQVLKLWDADTGECLKTWQGHNNWIWTITISPDGRQLASGNLDRTIGLWDIRTGELTQTLHGHQNWVWSVAFSPNGQILASSGDDETIRLWHVKTGECRATLQIHPKRAAWTVAFSPDGQWLASGEYGGTVRFWDAATGENLRCIAAHRDSHSIWAVVFSLDGQSLASSSDDKTIKLWDVKTGECRLSITDPASKVQAIAFHPNGQKLVSGGDARQVKLWDLATGELIQIFAGHTDSILGLVFNADGKTIASASADSTIRFWEVSTGECIRVLKGHASSVRGLAFTPDGQTLASSSTDNTIRFWDVETGQTLNLLRPQRPYEGMKIANAQGLTIAQKDALIALGAVQ